MLADRLFGASASLYRSCPAPTTALNHSVISGRPSSFCVSHLYHSNAHGLFIFFLHPDPNPDITESRLSVTQNWMAVSIACLGLSGQKSNLTVTWGSIGVPRKCAQAVRGISKVFPAPWACSREGMHVRSGLRWGPLATTNAPKARREVSNEGTRRCEVVQRIQGIWIHSTVERRGCIRPFLRHSGRWLQDIE